MKAVHIKCPILGCENPFIRSYGGITTANRIDDHLMRVHSIEDVIDYVRREIMKYNKKRMENESQRI